MTDRFTLSVALIFGLAMGGPLAAQQDRKGLIRNDAGAFAGYTLFAPLRSTTTYLVNMDGKVVHTWKSEYSPGNSAYLLENGDLLRAVREPDPPVFRGGGIGGRIQKLDWNSNLIWDFAYANEEHCQHHDIEPLPGGSVLLIAWGRKSKSEAVAAGRDPASIGDDGLWPDSVIEVRPKGKHGAEVVWRWNVWDHLVQDHDSDKANFGKVAEHPELVDINYGRSRRGPSNAETERLRALGYVGGRDEPDRRPGGRRGGRSGADWLHTNSIAYNADLDQIALSIHGLNEVWIIDHATTTEQAAGHTGGRYGKGGDLLYRWGNPHTYRAGSRADQRFFAQHDARWIPKGLRGGGHLLVFNNGRGRRDGQYSSIDEIATPVAKDGSYKLRPGRAHAPAEPEWRYLSEKKRDFFSGHISGAERLANGNTLICSGEQGRIFEVDAGGKTVWEYVNPYGGAVDRDGRRAGRAGPRAGRRPGGPGDRPRRRGPRDGPRGRGRGRGGPGSPRALFRAARIAPDHPGLAGRDLSLKTTPAGDGGRDTEGAGKP